MLAFGSIEHITHLCLRNLSRERVGETMLPQGLGLRIDLMREILSAREGAPYKRLDSLLNEAKLQSSDRNLIAHNPLVLDFYADSDDQIFQQAKIRSARKKDHHLTLAALKDRRIRAENLAQALLSAFQEAHAFHFQQDISCEECEK